LTSIDISEPKILSKIELVLNVDDELFLTSEKEPLSLLTSKIVLLSPNNLFFSTSKKPPIKPLTNLDTL